MAITGWLLVAAAGSSLLTALLVYLILRWKVLPELERRVEQRIRASHDELAQAIERGVKRGLLDGVASSLPSREVLQDTTRTIARTGMEMMGDSLNAWLGARRRRRTDRDGPGNDSTG